MSKTEIVNQLHSFLSDRALLAELDNFPVHNQEHTKRFIAKVNIALNQNARCVWNDWGYVEPVGAAMLMSGFVVVVGQKFSPDFAYTNIYAAIVGSLYALIGIIRHWYLQRLTWQGTLAVDDMLSAMTGDEVADWQHWRLQTEIIFRFTAVGMDAKKIENLSYHQVCPGKAYSVNKKKAADFIAAVEKLLPNFRSQLCFYVSRSCNVVRAGGMALIIFGSFSLFRLGNDCADLYGIISAVSFIMLAFQARQAVFTFKHAGNLIKKWDIDRVNTILALLKEEYGLGQILEIKALPPKSAPAVIEGKEVNKYRSGNKKSKSCNEKWIQGGAFLFNMVKAVALFGFQIISKPFCAEAKVDKYTEEEIHAQPKLSKKTKQSFLSAISEAKKPAKPVKKKLQNNHAKHTASVLELMPQVEQLSLGTVSLTVPDEITQAPPKPDSSAAVQLPTVELSPTIEEPKTQDSEKSALFTEKKSAAVERATTAPVELNSAQQKTPKAAEQRGNESTLSVGSTSTSSMEEMPILLMPKPADSDENKSAGPELAASQTSITITSPDFFGGKSFQVTVPARDAPRWSALRLTKEERLAILEESHSLVCNTANRNHSEVQKLLGALRTAQTPRKKKKSRPGVLPALTANPPPPPPSASLSPNG